MVPEGWEEKKLISIAAIVMGQSPPSSHYNENKQGIPFYQGTTEFAYMYPIPKKWIEKPIKIAEKNSILISVRAPVGELNIANVQCCIGRGLAAIKAKNNSQAFLYYVLMNNNKEFIKISQGSTFDAINKNDIDNLTILLPPLPEQKKIASILGGVDETIRATQAVIDQTGRVKKGLLQELLTRGIGHTRFKKVKLGNEEVKIPEAWEESLLIETGSKVIDGDRGKEYPKKIDYFQKGYCLFLNAGNVTKNGFNFTTCFFISAEKNKKLGKGELLMHDIIITTRGTIGNFAYYCDSINFDHIRINSGMAIIRPNIKVFYPKYLYKFMESQTIKKQIAKMVFGSAQPQLTIKLINKFKILLPPLPEQKKIAAILGNVDEALRRNQAKLEELRQVKKGLMQDLLTGKVRVKV